MAIDLGKADCSRTDADGYSASFEEDKNGYDFHVLTLSSIYVRSKIDRYVT